MQRNVLEWGAHIKSSLLSFLYILINNYLASIFISSISDNVERLSKYENYFPKIAKIYGDKSAIIVARVQCIIWS